jgi:hypothetical protein
MQSYYHRRVDEQYYVEVSGENCRANLCAELVPEFHVPDVCGCVKGQFVGAC